MHTNQVKLTHSEQTPAAVKSGRGRCTVKAAHLYTEREREREREIVFLMLLKDSNSIGIFYCFSTFGTILNIIILLTFRKLH